MTLKWRVDHPVAAPVEEGISDYMSESGIEKNLIPSASFTIAQFLPLPLGHLHQRRMGEADS